MSEVPTPVTAETQPVTTMVPAVAPSAVTPLSVPAEPALPTSIEEVDALKVKLARSEEAMAAEALRRSELEVTMLRQELEKRQQVREEAVKGLWEEYQLTPEDEVSLDTFEITRK